MSILNFSIYATVYEYLYYNNEDYSKCKWLRRAGGKTVTRVKDIINQMKQNLLKVRRPHKVLAHNREETINK